MHSWRLRSCLKWITFTLLIAIIARCNANQCVNRVYQPIYVGGPPLPAEEILSRHVVGGSIRVTAVKCLFLCEEHTRCVGFNVRASFNHENCQLTNVTKSKNKTGSTKGEWKLFRDLEATNCKGVICHNGSGCASNHKEGTWQCRCSVNYAGKHCENYNPYGGMIDSSGIVHNELFLVKGMFNHPTAKKVCNAFGAHQPSWEDIARIAREAEYGFCKP
ncbi:neurogenic locus notch homolog 2-like [Paramuricea clavata]|uniref:Neurogenic locus notch homolog 2-like n=1 Tax=Paramuricea clavata TaxID=317549 RepID=A0A7D9F0M6_PARCT|nr:neurogenic locus notch homolog 2-like [Paramuricea clavata]